MYTISKVFAFEAAHRLLGLPEGHQCGRPHGHSYVVEFELRWGGLDEHGFVEDYGHLDDIKRWIDATLDHRDLNEVMKPTQTSAENLAKWLYEMWVMAHPYLSAVRVKETLKTTAEWRP